MTHLIKTHAVCKFSYFRLWYLKSYLNSTKNWGIGHDSELRGMDALSREGTLPLYFASRLKGGHLLKEKLALVRENSFLKE